MDYTRSKGTSEEDLLSMSGVRGLLCAIFASNIVTTGSNDWKICNNQNIEQGTYTQLKFTKRGTNTRQLDKVGAIL